MEYLDPDEYEALTGTTKVEYEARVLAAARGPERPECLFGYRRELWPVEAWREVS